MATTARILIIDDDESVLEFISEALTDEGYEVTTALDGGRALMLIASAPPDLIILDAHMPIMDGQAFSQAYRQTPGPHAPLIIITASRDAATAAEEIGAGGYLAKPFDLEAFLALVEQHIHRKGCGG